MALRHLNTIRTTLLSKSLQKSKLKEGVARQHSEAALTKEIREDLAKNVMPYMIPQTFCLPR